MNFSTMRDLLIKHFNEMCVGIQCLYEVELDKDKLYELYLDSFPEGTNEIYRERRQHDCSACKQFIRNFGNVVTLKNGVIDTIWNFQTGDEVYQPVLNALNDFVKSCAINNFYVSKQKRIGIPENFELDGGECITWTHFYVELPEYLIDSSNKSVAEIQGDAKATKDVFYRSLSEITEDAVLTVIELISDNSLYRGAEWNSPLRHFLEHKRAFDQLSDSMKELYAWEQSYKVGGAIGRIRNHSIGTLLVDISEGVDLNDAVSRYEKIVAPENYKRPKEIFTAKMLEDAKKTIIELGYLDSLGRRFATLDDITVNNILFTNKDSAKHISGAEDVFAAMEKKAVNNPHKFDHVQEIDIEKFISDVLPTASEIEMYVENKHTNNFVSLIAPKNRDSKSMFKWKHNFSWAYAGNVTDSMKDRVKAAGGNVDGDLRFSIQWNDGSDYNSNDFDAHCLEPNGYEIYFGNKRALSPNKGVLDVDIIDPLHGSPAVENITYRNRNTMQEGVYTLFVNCYTDRGGIDGFRAEIEFDGQIYAFDYNMPVHSGDNIILAEVSLKGGKFSIKEKMPSSQSSKTVWNIPTFNFVPVSTIMYSPNYWDDQSGIGNKHYFFMLKDCINPETPNGFYNEFLKNELTEHKRVFAALGSQMRVEPSTDQLSGLGFSSTKQNEVVVKVKGNSERMLKIKF